MTEKGIGKVVIFTGLESMIWKFGEEVTGFIATMQDSLDGGGLRVAYGIFILSESRKFPTPTRRLSW
jgi:hypothetical protein